MSYITLKKQNEITICTLDRPAKHNAFNLEYLCELEAAFHKLAGDTSCRLVILTGAGNKAFSSGVDLTELIKFESIEEARAFALQLEETMAALLRFSKPLVAAINGFAFGGGFGLASSVDYRVAVDTATIGFPAVRLGAILPVGCTLRLNALVGAGSSRELLLTGRIVDAREALALGLVNKVVQAEDLTDTALSVAHEILRGSDQALMLTKQMTNQELLQQMQAYSVSAAENFAYLAFTRDWKQRIQSFLKQKAGK